MRPHHPLARSRRTPAFGPAGAGPVQRAGVRHRGQCARPRSVRRRHRGDRRGSRRDLLDRRRIWPVVVPCRGRRHRAGPLGSARLRGGIRRGRLSRDGDAAGDRRAPTAQSRVRGAGPFRRRQPPHPRFPEPARPSRRRGARPRPARPAVDARHRDRRGHRTVPLPARQAGAVSGATPRSAMSTVPI